MSSIDTCDKCGEEHNIKTRHVCSHNNKGDKMKQNNFKPKYKFVKYKDDSNRFDTSKIVHYVDTEDLNKLLQEFEAFIRGCGFYPKGTLQFVNDEEENA